ncbi:MAG TPA: sigma-54 dependent transcriptional regulator [Geobacteraceae bacterium]|nr:sigma-54 dependent transcriptional regulator [Geobacteraceae bacterium]
MKALIIDDETGIRLSLSHFLKERGYETLEAVSGAEGLALARSSFPDIVFLDKKLPDCAGESLLPFLVSPEAEASVIMMTAYVELDEAVKVMKQGAEYFFAKPFDLNQLALVLESIEERYRLKNDLLHCRNLNVHAGSSSPGMVGVSPQINRIQRLISLLARNCTTPVLILGESGSGKELVATAIHQQGMSSGPFVEINSASLSETLLESELFGHEKGAFTDASKMKKGLFEIAHDGTIFFDELAEMPLPIQAKLLKVLDSKIFRRVGGVADIRSNARFIGATNKDLGVLVKKGLFREDLFYRINVIPITIPPLRERGRDIVLLAEHFIRLLGEEMGKTRMRASSEFMQALIRHNWPGNVRELKNIIERALILTESQELSPNHLPEELRVTNSAPEGSISDAEFPTLQTIEDQHIRAALRFTNGNHSRTASILGISRSTLLVKLKTIQSTVQ